MSILDGKPDHHAEPDPPWPRGRTRLRYATAQPDRTVNVYTNKQLAHINRQAVALKVSDGLPITKAELAVYLGVSYTLVRSWAWLPMLGQLLFFDDFTLARQRHLGLEFYPQMLAHLRKSNAGKSGKSPCS